MLARLLMLAAVLGLSAPMLAQTGHPAKGSWSGDLIVSESEKSRVRLLIDAWNGDLAGTVNPGRNGVDMSKVKVETVLANAEPLLVGKVDFFTGMLHNQTYQVEQEAAKPDAPANLKGKVWKAVSFSKYGVPSYGDVLFTSGKLVREKPELVRKVTRAVAKGMKFTLEHPADAVKVVDANPQQIERADKLAWRLKVQNPMNVSTDTKASGLLWMNPKIWDGVMAFYKEYEQIPRVLPAAEVMTNSFNSGVKLN